MSIRWDAPLTRAVAEELEEELAGAELRALRLDGVERDLFMLFRDRTLVWRLHPTRGEVLLRPPTAPGPSDLRHAARVRRITAPPDERLVRIELLPKRGGPPRDVVVELLGNQWNAVVIEAASRVVRHVLWSRSSGRGHAVGAHYSAPKGQERDGTDGELSLEQWQRIVSEEPPARRALALIRTVAWTSPLNAPALLGEDLHTSDDERIATGYLRWRALAMGQGRPVLLELESGLQPYPSQLAGTPSHEVESLLAAFDEVRTRDAGEDAEPSLLDPEILGRIEELAIRSRRRVEQLEHELDTLGDPAALRSIGDLILARYSEVPAGSTGAVLLGFDGESVHVELEPELEPHENATRYYDQAARVERAARRLPPLLEEARREASSLKDLLGRGRSGVAGIDELRDALPPQPSGGGRSSDEGISLPYRTFRSSGGLEIRVGRGAKHNDDLTFRYSAPHDVWLHARHAAGAHVILRWAGPGNPPSRDLAEAATLAALHSKARTSGSVPVDWTLRKYVRKPRGAARGAVIPDRVSTVFVRPDPELERSLTGG